MSEGGDTFEDFWGCTLTKGKNETTWDPLETEEDIEHKLQLTSACLGAKAKDGERNLVEVTTANDNGEEVVCSIVSLRAGGNECMHLELGFNNPTKFRLREGTGPLSLCGTHLKAAPLDMMDDEDFSDSEDDEDIPNLVEPKKAVAPKPVIEKKTEPTKNEKKTEDKPGKRPLEDKKDKQTPSKKKKVEPEPEPEESDEDEDEPEEGDESGEDEEGSEDEEMPSLLDGEAVEDDDEESEDEDEPEEGDDVDSEEDEEEGEEEGSEVDEEEEDVDEEEESEEEKTPAKKPLTNGHAKKTPAKKDEKTPAKTPSKSAGAKKGTDEIKSLLLKSPNLPKKFDKFANYMKNNLKVTDKKTQQEVWDFVQKNRKQKIECSFIVSVSLL